MQPMRLVTIIIFKAIYLFYTNSIYQILNKGYFKAIYKASKVNYIHFFI